MTSSSSRRARKRPTKGNVIVPESLSGQLLDLFSGDGRRIVLVINAYLDESGMDEQAPCVTVAGWCGTKEEWQKFETEWKQILQRREIDVFHAKEHKDLWPAMKSALRRRNVRGFVCTIPKRLYKEVSQETRNWGGNFYAVAAQACAHAIAAHARNVHLGKAAFVIEAGQPNVSFVRERLEALINEEAFSIAAVAVATKKDFVPLQTADFLSHIFANNKKVWINALIGKGNGRALLWHFKEDDVRRLNAAYERLAKRSRQLRDERRAIVKKMKKAMASKS